MKPLFTMLVLALVGCVAISLSPAVAADTKAADAAGKTFLGTVNEDARFVAQDGEEYLIVGDIAQDVIVKQGEKLKITGEVREEGEGRAIAVESVEVLDDYAFQQEMEQQRKESGGAQTQ